MRINFLSIYWLFVEGLLQVDFNPSICSNNEGSIGFHIGSKTKSIPSLLASLAAGTKSQSPEIRMIRSTCFFNAIDVISVPIFISMPF